MHWIQFLISAVVIVFSGIKLTGYADAISDRLGWGKVWIGVLLLGLVTSLPEAITSFMSIVYLQADNLAIGNLLGSNTFNPMIIVVLDIVSRKGSLTNTVNVNRSHKISGFFAILLTSLVLWEVFISSRGIVLAWGRVSLWTLALGILYFLGMRMLSQEGHDAEIIADDETATKENHPLTAIYMKALISAVVIIVSAIFLSNSADTIAESTGLGRTFVGSIFLAFATSLPEIVVSLSALRLGAVDMAIGNIFGSNMTNMFILVLCGLLRGGAPILSVVSPTHMVTAAIGILLTLVIFVSIHKKKRSFFSVGWDSIVMLTIFVLGMRALYLLK